MGTSAADFEGTAGNRPSAPDSGYAAWTVYSAPAASASDWALNATQKRAGALSGRANDTTTQANFYCNPATGTIYFRGYYYLTAAPLSAFAFALLWGDGYTRMNTVGMTPSRQVGVYKNTTGTATFASLSSANVIALGEWFRFEGAISKSSVEARLWTGGNVDSAGTADVTVGPYTTGTSITTEDTFGVGLNTWNGSAAYAPLNSGQFLYMDDFAISDAGWIGPAAIPAFKRGLGIVRY